MEALEDPEDSLRVGGLEPDPVVLDDDAAVWPPCSRPRRRFRFRAQVLRGDPDGGSHAGAVELERVAQQVLKQLHHLRWIRLDLGQGPDLHASVEPLDPRLQVADHLARHIAEVHERDRLRLARQAGDLEQVLDQILHPPSRAPDPVQRIRALPCLDINELTGNLVSLDKREVSEGVSLRLNAQA